VAGSKITGIMASQEILLAPPRQGILILSFIVAIIFFRRIPGTGLHLIKLKIKQGK
jgi:hypothetical protein